MRQRLATSLFNTNNCATAHSYYFDHHGDTPYLRPTSAAQAWRAARTLPLDDYRFESLPALDVDGRNSNTITIKIGRAL